MQSVIDAIEYPPTHTYRLEGLEPTDVLARRVEILDRIAPGFFSRAKRFLDVAANKGFFTLLAAKGCKHVTALEPDDECVDLLRQIVPANVEVVKGGLKALKSRPPYDRVWLGHAHHYIYREYEGWQWIGQLANLCSGHFLVEGPDGMDCKDMEKAIPPELQSNFTRSQWLGSLETWFDILAEVPTDPYTPNRYVWYCKKRAEAAPYSDRVLMPVYRLANEYIRSTDTVVEVCVREDRGAISRQYFKCQEFICVDRDAERVQIAGGGVVADVLVDPLPASDVTLTTALLHHTAPEQLPLLMANLCKGTRRNLLISGPDVRKQPSLYADHLWHLEIARIVDLAKVNGFMLFDVQSVGRGDVFLAFGREFCI